MKTEIISRIKHQFHTELFFKITDNGGICSHGQMIIYDIDVEAGPNALAEATTISNALKEEIRKLGQVILNENI